MPYQRIAENLLETHCDVDSFEVDFIDVEASAKIAAALTALGAKVKQLPNTTRLHVICPKGLQSSARADNGNSPP